MIVRAPDERALASPLGRLAPVTKLGISLLWLIGLALVVDPRPPVVVAFAAAASGIAFGGLDPARLARGVAPLLVAAVGVGVFNALFSGSNGDPLARTVLTLGPLRLTEPAVLAGLSLGLRILAIATVGVVFALTTDSTALVDSLVVHARVPERFAYGALAAYQAVPRLADDLATLRQARRIRGLRGSWHPRLLVGLLVLAIRHGDRLALAMDARGFGSGPRTRYREVRVGWLDAVAVVVAVVVLA
ncbi:MAG TPA: energy-coupling factor transporter transmembrane component T, partial [Candidatus Limnocylindrales bacterium]|nr:energy-coupling factor transporter transmembrane component T [Candidatus Limnocylindrales bacterium]